MSTRTPDQAMDEVLAVTPEGFAWPAQPGSNWAKHLAPWGDALAQAEAAMASLVAQSDIRNATDLLPDYEASLGPDPAGRDLPGLPVEERQRQAWQRWTTRGPRTPAFFIALAAKLGVAVTIDEPILSVCGVAQCGDEMTVDPEQFVWRVNLPTSDPQAALRDAQMAGECGVMECAADPLADVLAPFAGLIALIRRLNPPHMAVCFGGGTGVS